MCIQSTQSEVSREYSQTVLGGSVGKVSQSFAQSSQASTIRKRSPELAAYFTSWSSMKT